MSQALQLNLEQQAQYKEQGYVLIENALSSSQVASMKQRAQQIIHEDIQQSHADHTDNKVFTTKHNDRTGNAFFLDSAEKVRCFYEEDAFNTDGNLAQEPELCINKIGHALHELDPVFKNISHMPSLGTIAKQLGLVQPEIRQSMYIFKQPRIGGVVNWHQDATFFYTTPQSVVTFWFAIEDATLDNGCLWVERNNVNRALREVFKRNGNETSMTQLDDTPWPDDSNAIPIEVKAGSLLCFAGNIAHYSAPNRSSKSRHAYTLHITDGQASYSEENWIQPRELPLRGFDF